MISRVQEFRSDNSARIGTRVTCKLALSAFPSDFRIGLPQERLLCIVDFRCRLFYHAGPSCACHTDSLYNFGTIGPEPAGF